jgi:transcriptional regulator with XRE-family HTH domain
LTATRDLQTLVESRRALPEPRVRRMIREAAGVSLQAVADHVGVTKQAVAFWETGGRGPSPEFLPSYIEALRILKGGGP